MLARTPWIVGQVIAAIRTFTAQRVRQCPAALNGSLRLTPSIRQLVAPMRTFVAPQ
jgi:hypothetical protein